jgi:hypothetical protein
VLAYDGFNYTVGGGANWNGQGSGDGFTGPWTLSSTTNANVLSGSLNFSQLGHALTTSGNSVNLTAYATGTRTLAAPVGTLGTTLWVGFEFKVTSAATTALELDLNTTGAGNGIRLGSPFNGRVDARVTTSAGDWFLSSTTPVVQNAVNYVVYKIQYLSTGSIISMYINPTPGVMPTTASGTLTLPSTATLPVNSTLILRSSSTTVTTFDEIRLGVSYAAVSPDPLEEWTPARTARHVLTPRFNGKPRGISSGSSVSNQIVPQVGLTIAAGFIGRSFMSHGSLFKLAASETGSRPGSLQVQTSAIRVVDLSGLLTPAVDYHWADASQGYHAYQTFSEECCEEEAVEDEVVVDADSDGNIDP